MSEQNIPQEEQKEQSMFLKPVLMIVATIIVVGGWAWYLQKNANVEPAPVEQKENQGDKQANISGAVGDFSLSDTSGKTVSLADLKDEKSILTFWHASCGWCTKQLPELYTLAGNNPDIKFLAVNVGDKVEDLSDFLVNKPANVTILLDSDFAVANEYEVSGTPTHFLVNGEGKLVETVSGYRSVADFQTIIDGAF